MALSPFIFGCEGPFLSTRERCFFRKFNPLALFSFHEILRSLRKFANFAQICAPPLAGMRPL